MLLRERDFGALSDEMGSMTCMVDMSFAIPTRGRTELLVETVETICRIPSSSIEIVISDNDDTPRESLDDLVRTDSRIRIVRPPSPLHMTDNFDFCASACSGDWLYFLGADDGIIASRYAEFEVALQGSDTGVVVGGGAGFFWPGVRSPSKGRLSWWLPRKSDPYVVSTEPVRTYFRRHVAGRADPKLSPPELPMLYMFGAVRHDVVDRIRNRTGGRLFKTVTPDWFLTAAIADTVDAFEVVPRGIGIQGAGPDSNGINSSVDWEGWTDRRHESSLTEAGSGSKAFGDLGIYSLELLWMDVWSTLWGHEPPLDRQVLADTARFLGSVTPALQRDAVREYLSHLSSDLAPEVCANFDLAFRDSVRERARRRRGPLRIAMNNMLAGSTYFRSESEALTGITSAAELLECVDRVALSGKRSASWLPSSRRFNAREHSVLRLSGGTCMAEGISKLRQVF